MHVDESEEPSLGEHPGVAELAEDSRTIHVQPAIFPEHQQNAQPGPELFLDTALDHAVAAKAHAEPDLEVCPVAEMHVEDAQSHIAKC